MSRQRKEVATRHVAVEICRSTFRVVSARRAAPEDLGQVTTRAIPWREKANSLHSETGVEELAAALKEFAATEKLGHFPVRVALNGDFCVTRVITGREDQVRRELAQLEERSQRYLSLGPGRKAIAGCIRPIDARQQLALLTVSNQKTVETVLSAFQKAGVEVELIEPSLVSLSRVIGTEGHDREAPVILLNLDERGIELGISHRGRLVLDYRPGGRLADDDVAWVVSQHIARLQRYCSRKLRFIEGDLRKIYVCGEDEQVRRALSGFSQDDRLDAQELDLSGLAGDWEFTDGKAGSEFAAAAGTCLLLDEHHRNITPNLMENIRSTAKRPVLALLARKAWPLAAALLLALGMLGVDCEQRYECRALEAELDQLRPSHMRETRLLMSLRQAETMACQLQIVSQKISRPAWHSFVRMVGSCMPPDVWLDRLEVGREGNIQIVGYSYGEEGVFEFNSWLQKSANLRNVALEKANWTRGDRGPVLQFHLVAEFAGQGTEESEENDHD